MTKGCATCSSEPFAKRTPTTLIIPQKTETISLYPLKIREMNLVIEAGRGTFEGAFATSLCPLLSTVSISRVAESAVAVREERHMTCSYPTATRNNGRDAHQLGGMLYPTMMILIAHQSHTCGHNSAILRRLTLRAFSEYIRTFVATPTCVSEAFWTLL